MKEQDKQLQPGSKSLPPSSPPIVGRDEIFQARIDRVTGESSENPSPTFGTVEEMMLSGSCVVITSPTDTLHDVYQVLQERHLEPLPVFVMEDGRCLGIINQKVLEDRLPSHIPQGFTSSLQLTQLLKETAVNDILSSQPITVSPKTPLQEAAEIMVQHQLDALPVVDNEEHPLGIIKLQDSLDPMDRS